MKKELPQPKKTLKSFILDEDAKVMDKTAVKIALSASFMSAMFLSQVDDANAKGHKNHSNHQNNVNAPNSVETNIHAGNNPTNAEVNSITDKGVLSMHSNHYNHTDAEGSQNWIAIAVGVITGGLGGWVLFGPLGGALGGAFFGGVGDLDSFYDEADMEVINTGSPYHVPDDVLIILEEQED